MIGRSCFQKRRIAATARRFFRFGAVGALGVAVQLATLAGLLRFTGLHYLAATAVAVEAAVLHNFVWHMKWTWADRPSRLLTTLVKFNLSNGLTSLVGNVILMFFFVKSVGIHPQLASLITIALCSAINFALADRVVFV